MRPTHLTLHIDGYSAGVVDTTIAGCGEEAVVEPGAEDVVARHRNVTCQPCSN